MSGNTTIALPRQRKQNSIWINNCIICDSVDASEWVGPCRQMYPSATILDGVRRRRAKDRAGQIWDESGARRLEELFKELFHLHDLNGNGLLEEMELIKLNEKIALLHYGKDADTSDVQAKYAAVFRAKLDPKGRPVPYEKFRIYAREVIDGLDRDPEAQEMILEQFVAEAQSGRLAFDIPSFENESDLPFKPNKMGTQALSTEVIETPHEVIETPQELIIEEMFIEGDTWRSTVKWL